MALIAPIAPTTVIENSVTDISNSVSETPAAEASP
jgi:hypothetical protein